MFEKIDRFIRDLNHQRIDWMREVKLSLAQILFPLWQKKSLIENKKAAILVFRLDDKIGDGITATGFLFELKRNFPESRLIVLAGPNSAFIYRELGFVDEVLTLKKGLSNSFEVYSKLTNQEFRFILNTSHLLSPQVVFLNSWLKAFRKLTFLNGDDDSFTDHVIYNKAIDHVTVRYQKILNALGLSSVNLDYHLNLKSSDETKKAAQAVASTREKTARVILLNSFSGARLRNLSPQTTTEIVRGLLKAIPDLSIISVGSKDDLNLAQKWIAEVRDPRWVCFPEGTSLAFNFELAKHVDLIVTPDTSWVHVASAFKKPVVAIFREDEAYEKNSLIWAPYKTKSKVLYAPFEATRPYDINTVSAQRVVKMVQELFDAK